MISKQAPSTRTTDPVVVGASVLAVKYKGGVMMMADTLASYGSLARYTDVQRIVPLAQTALLGASGEFSDFQEIQKII